MIIYQVFFKKQGNDQALLQFCSIFLAWSDFRISACQIYEDCFVKLLSKLHYFCIKRVKPFNIPISWQPD